MYRHYPVDECYIQRSWVRLQPNFVFDFPPSGWLVPHSCSWLEMYYEHSWDVEWWFGSVANSIPSLTFTKSDTRFDRKLTVHLLRRLFQQVWCLMKVWRSGSATLFCPSKNYVHCNVMLGTFITKCHKYFSFFLLHTFLHITLSSQEWFCQFY